MLAASDSAGGTEPVRLGTSVVSYAVAHPLEPVETLEYDLHEYPDSADDPHPDTADFAIAVLESRAAEFVQTDEVLQCASA